MPEFGEFLHEEEIEAFFQNIQVIRSKLFRPDANPEVASGQVGSNFRILQKREARRTDRAGNAFSFFSIFIFVGGALCGAYFLSDALEVPRGNRVLLNSLFQPALSLRIQSPKILSGFRVP